MARREERQHKVYAISVQEFPVCYHSDDIHSNHAVQRLRICIGKIIPYKSLGSYTIHLNTMLIPTNNAGQVALNLMKTYVPQFNKGTGDGVEVYTVETPHWMMLVLKASNLVFDSDDQTVEIQLPGFPSDISINPPIIYNESLWSNLGSKRYPATLRNGILTISKDGAADEPANVGTKFTRMIVVRDNN